jgi:hypothetical protein
MGKKHFFEMYEKKTCIECKDLLKIRKNLENEGGS